MHNPEILGRMDDDDTIDIRSSTSHIGTAEIPFEGGACGKVTVKVFKSDDDEDRGGLVFRITLDDLVV